MAPAVCDQVALEIDQVSVPVVQFVAAEKSLSAVAVISSDPITATEFEPWMVNLEVGVLVPIPT